MKTNWFFSGPSNEVKYLNFFSKSSSSLRLFTQRVFHRSFHSLLSTQSLSSKSFFSIAYIRMFSILRVFFVFPVSPWRTIKWIFGPSDILGPCPYHFIAQFSKFIVIDSSTCFLSYLLSLFGDFQVLQFYIFYL